MTKSKSEDGPGGLTSPTSGGARPITRSRPSSGSHRPPSGSNQGSAAQHARSRPFAGSKSGGRTTSGRTKTEVQNVNAQSVGDQSKPLGLTVDCTQSVDAPATIGLSVRKDATGHGLKGKENIHSTPSGIPLPKSKIPPKVSPKPAASPRISPAVSPKPGRAFFNLQPACGRPEEAVKALARDNILSALARRSGVPPVKQELEEAGAPQTGEPLSQQVKNSESVKQEESASHLPVSGEEVRLSVNIEGVTTTCTTDELKSGPTSPEIPKEENRDLSKDLCVEKDRNDHVDTTNSEVSTPSPQSPVSEIKVADKRDSPSGSPRLKPKKQVVKPTIAPPPPPPQIRKESPEVSPQKPAEVRNGHVGAATKSSPHGSPTPAHTKLVKCGLDGKGADVPPCRLIGSGGVPKSVSPDRAALPLKVFSPDHKGSTSSLESYRKDSSLPASDSNFDADDEEEQAANNTVSQNPKICVKSFSVEQGDLSYTPIDARVKARPSSSAAISGESDSSSIGSGDNVSLKSKKGNGVFNKLRKISLSLLPLDNGDKRQMGKAIFYGDEDAKEGANVEQQEVCHTVGKAVFYSSDSVANGDSTTSQEEGTKRGTNSPVERRKSKVSLRQKTCAVERKLSNRSGFFVENDFYEASNGNHAYENVVFGPVTTTDPGGNSNNTAKRLTSSSQESDEGKNQGIAPPKSPIEPMEIQTGEGQPGERTSTDTPDEDEHPPIYDNVKPADTNPYANVLFTSGYRGRSVWRRKTIKKRTTRRKIPPAGDGQENQDGERTPETIEEFSNSDDSFDSDSFTDESDEEKNKLDATYASIEVS